MSSAERCAGPVAGDDPTVNDMVLAHYGLCDVRSPEDRYLRDIAGNDQRATPSRKAEICQIGMTCSYIGFHYVGKDDVGPDVPSAILKRG
jgi:hypothetical protein